MTTAYFTAYASPSGRKLTLPLSSVISITPTLGVSLQITYRDERSRIKTAAVYADELMAAAAVDAPVAKPKRDAEKARIYMASYMKARRAKAKAAKLAASVEVRPAQVIRRPRRRDKETMPYFCGIAARDRIGLPGLSLAVH